MRLPGSHRRVLVTPQRVAGLLLLIPLIYAIYLAVQVWQLEHQIVKRMPNQANAVLTPRPRGTQPVLIFPTQPGKPSPTAPPTGTPAAGSGQTTPQTTRTAVIPTSQVPTTPGVPTPANLGAVVPTIAQTGKPTVTVNSSISRFHGKKRINVVMLGIDQRSDEPTRADTIILASLDFEHNKAYVLSVPRDLYVDVPGFQYWKINAAYSIGENPKHSKDVGGGIGLMITTLRSDFGIDIDAFGVLNFNGFVEGVDRLGGIDIIVPKKLVDRKYPEGTKYTRVAFEKGPQHMNGGRALKYARIRHVDSDFGRIGRQQQVLLAVQQKARNPAMILRAPTLLNVVKGNFTTSLGLSDQVRLARWGASLPRENIEFYAIDGRIGTVQDTGESVVYADWKKINPTLKKVFGPQASHP